MAIVFPKSNNPFWPLPPDYHTLDKEGQRKARCNACAMTGRPDLDTAAWLFFRETYLIPRAQFWYKTGFTGSPLAHAQWVYDWNKYNLLVHAAPRGTSKTTVNLEDIARKVIALPGFEAVLFLSTIRFCGDRLGRLMDLVEYNPLIIRDFGKLKGSPWNRASEMRLKNGSAVQAFPIKGASLGTRPSGMICLDDVEVSDDQVVTPADRRELMREFFFNALYPMSRSPGHSVPVRIIGTLYNRRMFIYWLNKTEDDRVKAFWKRTLMTIKDMNWEVFNEEWQETEKRKIGITAFNAQYMNDPGTGADKVLSIHPELCTYWLEDEDGAATTDPFNSDAYIITHQLKGWVKEDPKAEPVPVPMPIRRKWSDVVSNMRRFITVDWAPTTSPDADYSVVHVMGFENDDAHRDTLYTLDVWWGKVRPEELLRIVYQMSMRWQAGLVGVEAYPVLAEFYERVRDDLPGMYGQGQVPPRVIPIKFPPKMDKASKILGLEWRFVQFRVKLPVDRRERNPGIGRLFWEIENVSEPDLQGNMPFLDHDDCVDSLAMHLAIGKPHKAAGPDIIPTVDPNKMILEGRFTHEDTGLSVLSGINASELSNAALAKLRQARYDEIAEEYGEDWEENVVRDCGYMGLPASFF